MPTAVTITSVKNNLVSKTSTFYIFTDGISSQSAEQLSELIDENTSIIIKTVELPNNLNTANQKNNLSATPISLIKFELGSLLPSLDRVIYLDSDLIIKDDISDLQSIDLSGKTIAAVHNTYNHSHCAKLNVDDESYFNTGVMVIDLNKFRQISAQSKLYDYKINGFNAFMDQDAFNVVFKDDVLLLDYRYNLRIDTLLFQDFEIFKKTEKLPEDCTRGSALIDAKIIHYCTKYKPWKYHLPILNDYFEQYYYKSPYGKQPLRKEPYKFGVATNTIELTPNESEKYIAAIVDCRGCSLRELIRCFDSFFYQSKSCFQIYAIFLEDSFKEQLSKYHIINVKALKTAFDITNVISENYIMYISGKDSIYQDSGAFIIDLINAETNYDTIIFNYRRITKEYSSYDNRQVFRRGKQHYLSKDTVLTYEKIPAKRLAREGIVELCSAGCTMIFSKKYYRYESKKYKLEEWRNSLYGSIIKSNSVISLNMVICNLFAENNGNRAPFVAVKSAETDVKISVVMPIFNTQEYLPETLAALDNQQMKDVQYIFVDDGSTDKSQSLLLNYLDTHDNIVVVALNYNCGPGIARIIGSDYIRGSYVSYLDSDDLFEPDLLSTMYSECDTNGLDVVVVKSDEFDDKTGQVNTIENMYRFDLVEDISSVQCPKNN